MSIIYGISGVLFSYVIQRKKHIYCRCNSWQNIRCLMKAVNMVVTVCQI